MQRCCSKQILPGLFSVIRHTSVSYTIPGKDLDVIDKDNCAAIVIELVDQKVRVGQQVEKGDLLVKINPDLIQSALSQSQAGLQNVRAQLSQAEASLKNAEAAYNRNKKLFEKGVISKSEWDRSIADFEVAKTLFLLDINDIIEKQFNDENQKLGIRAIFDKR